MNVIDKNRIPVFVCVGSSRHPLDCVAPKIGSMLRDRGYRVIGTMEKPIHATNIHNLELDYDDRMYQIIGIDSCIGDKGRAYRTFYKPLRPGSAVDRKLPEIGEVSILVNVFYDSYVPAPLKTLSFIFAGDNRRNEYKTNIIASRITSHITSYLNYSATKSCEMSRKALEEGAMVLEGHTIRAVANAFRRSKSSVHYRIHTYLPEINPDMYKEVSLILFNRRKS